jgi:hypothetical protein
MIDIPENSLVIDELLGEEFSESSFTGTQLGSQ